MIAYKGFEKDLSCTAGGNRFQYRLGVVNTTEAANCGQNGFHCAEDPLDCLSYYSDWKNSAYYVVEATGDLHEDGSDTKISCTKIRLLKRLSLEQFVYVSLVYMCKHPFRKWNGNVFEEQGKTRTNKFVIVRGKNPSAAGALGDILGFAKESYHSSTIEEISVIRVDGEEYKPDVFYRIDGSQAVGGVL